MKMNKPDEYRKRFEDACDIFEKEKNKNCETFEKTGMALGRLVEAILIDFFNTHKDIDELSELKNTIAKHNCNGKVCFQFEHLELGTMFNRFYPQSDTKRSESDFIKKVKEKYSDKLCVLHELCTGEFGDVRNNAFHEEARNKLVLNEECMFRQFDLVSRVLKELGYNGYTFNECQVALRRRKLFNYTKKLKKKHESIMAEFVASPELKSAIDENLFSEFTCDSSLITLIDEIGKSPDNFWISGEGGIGKTTIVHHVYKVKKNEFYEKLRKNFNHYGKISAFFSPIPIIIPGHRLNILNNNSKNNCFNHAINGLLGTEFNILKVANELTKLYEQLPEKTDGPLIILLIDGFNEVHGIDEDICEQFLRYCAELAKQRIQVVVTSRTDVFRADKDVFKKKISATGVNEDKIIPYICDKRKDLDDRIVRTALSKKKISVVLKNPMFLILYTNYQFDIIVKNNQEDKEKSKKIQQLIDNKTFVPIESNIGDTCKAYILWNYVQYILYNNVFRQRVDVPFNIKKYQEQVERNQYTFASLLSTFLPEITGKLFTCDSVENESLEEPFEKQLKTFLKNRTTLENCECIIESAMWFLTDGTGLLRYTQMVTDEKRSLRFSHQNFRDFFAACDYTKIRLSGREKYTEETHEYLKTTHLSQINQTELRVQLKSGPILSDVKMLAGELLGERNENRSSILQHILEECLEKDNSEPTESQTIENIFEIYKALDVLDILHLKEFLRADFERLNFNEVNHKVFIDFVAEALNTINLKQLLQVLKSFSSEQKPFSTELDAFLQKIRQVSGFVPALKPFLQDLDSFSQEKLAIEEKKDAELMKRRLISLFRLSAHCTNYLRAEDIRKIYSVWIKWAKKNVPLESIPSMYASFAEPLIAELLHLLVDPLYELLANANIGIGKNDFLNIFREVNEYKKEFQELLLILDKRNDKQSEDESIVSAMYKLASCNGYASNFACFLLDYYLFHNLEDGLKLIAKLTEKMNAEQDSVKRTMMQFRIISGINFCVQESWCNKRTIPNELKKELQKIMNDFLDMELKNFSSEMATNYKNFEYGYYFPFGNYFAFDNGIDCIIDAEYSTEPQTTKQTKEKTFKKIFIGSKVDNLPLFQKVILDVAVVSTCTFFVQNEIYSDIQGDEETRNDKYLWNTFEFFKELIERLYPVDSADYNYKSMTDVEKRVWDSLCEALAIIHHYYPLKTEVFLDKASEKYQYNNANNRSADIRHLKDALRGIKEKKFKELCNAGLKDNSPYTIAKFIENYKNVLAFADLANNVLITFPIVTETLAMWGEKSFLKNIDTYEKDPKKFVEQTLKEIISVLRTPDSESKFVATKKALETC